MAEWLTFRNAPITEALIDLRCELPPETDLTVLARYQDDIRDRFPDRRDRTAWQVEFLGGQPEQIRSSGGQDGYLFESPVEKKVVQARLDGFTFSKLKPYDNWVAFRDEAFELWRHYVDVARPKRVTRIAVRYINSINVPLPFQDFKEYILTVPEIAPSVNQLLGTFFMRLVIPYPEAEAVAIVTEAMEPVSENSQVAPLVFDIDAFREVDLDRDSDTVWQSLDALRQLKNEIFFNSLTNKAKDLFK